MRVCYFGTYRAAYARNQILIDGLRQVGIHVTECHQPLWRGVDDRVQTASGGWKKPAFWLRTLRTYARLLAQYRRCGDYDILVVGYPGHMDVFLAWLLTRLRRKPLVWDVLNSLYLITLERGIHERSPFTGWLIRTLERGACRLPERMILDTPQFVEWFATTHNADASRFRLVQIGADERIFHPIARQMPPKEVFKVIYYGTYIPNHGVETIARAALLLSDDPQIQFEMIGAGPQRQLAEDIIAQAPQARVTFIDWLKPEALVQHIAAADLVLGVFGTTRQLSLTNNNKIYEGFAMRKAVVSGSSPALPPILQSGEHLYLVPRGQPDALAAAIRKLKADPTLREKLATSGFNVFQEHFNINAIGKRFAAHLEELLA